MSPAAPAAPTVHVIMYCGLLWQSARVSQKQDYAASCDSSSPGFPLGMNVSFMSSHALGSMAACPQHEKGAEQLKQVPVHALNSTEVTEITEPATLVQHWQGWSDQHTACVGTPWLEQTMPWTSLAPTAACSTHIHSWLQPSCLQVEPDLSVEPAARCLLPGPAPQLWACHHHPYPGCPCQHHHPLYHHCCH